ncbi:UNVERIFIED_CONTAM: hypothetical protein K2H54_062203 [Gekko kuhli]
MEEFAPFSLKRFTKYENKMAKEYGNVYTIWAGSLPVVVFSGFEAVKEAAVNHSTDFDERPVTPFFEAMGKGTGIIFSSGHIWKQQRKFGVVTLRKLGLGKKGIEHKIHEEAYHLAQTFADAKRQPLDPAIPITNSVTNVICALAFGQRFSLGDEEFRRLRDATCTIVNGWTGVFGFRVATAPFPRVNKSSILMVCNRLLASAASLIQASSETGWTVCRTVPRISDHNPNQYCSANTPSGHPRILAAWTS